MYLLRSEFFLLHHSYPHQLIQNAIPISGTQLDNHCVILFDFVKLESLEISQPLACEENVLQEKRRDACRNNSFFPQHGNCIASLDNQINSHNALDLETDLEALAKAQQELGLLLGIVMRERAVIFQLYAEDHVPVIAEPLCLKCQLELRYCFGWVDLDGNSFGWVDKECRDLA